MAYDSITRGDISRVTRDSDGAYHFKVCGTDYRTDNFGGGLWAWLPAPFMWSANGDRVYEWKQILGTCQFSVGSNPRAAAIKFALDGDPAYLDWLDGRPSSRNMAMQYYRYCM